MVLAFMVLAFSNYSSFIYQLTLLLFSLLGVGAHSAPYGGANTMFLLVMKNGLKEFLGSHLGGYAQG